MRIERRRFLGVAGAVMPAFSVGTAMAGAVPEVDIPNDGRVDATSILNDVLEEQSDVFLPAGIYRIDGTVTVPEHTRLVLAHGSVLKRMAQHNDSTDPVVGVIGNRAWLSGGQIITENNHPHGIVVLGHRDATKNTRYNATHWQFSDCSIMGRQEKGNIALWIPNAQAVHKTTNYANYFGYVQNIAIRGSDIGVLLDEVSNAHRFYGVFFSHLISSAWELRGAYANQVFGGFLHQSKNGIIAIRLRNATNDKYHDSIYNSFFGFGIEPGGSKSAAYDIDKGCRRNTLIIQSNVPGKSIDRSGENAISRHGGDWPNADSIS